MRHQTQKNSTLRNRIASQLRELRSWPPLNTARVPNLLRRPQIQETLANLVSPLSLAALAAQALNGAQHLEELELLEQGQSHDFETKVATAPPSCLNSIFVKANISEGLEGEPETYLVLYRNQRATDRQYDAHLAGTWGAYQRESQVSDDTDAQYEEYLRLKNIYEPGSLVGATL